MAGPAKNSMKAMMTAVLGLWWSILWRHLMAIVVVSGVVVFAGLIVVGLVNLLVMFGLRQFGSAPFAVAFAAGLFAVIQAQGAAVSDIVVRSAAGEPVDIGGVVKRVWRHVMPAMVIGLVYLVGVMTCTGALVIPGFLFGTACSVALPVYVAEKPPGLLKTFTRAFSLGRQRMFGIAMLWVLAFVVVYVSFRLLQAGIQALPLDRTRLGYVVIVFGAVVQAGFSLLNSAIYVSLREETGGLRDRTIAEVFE